MSDDEITLETPSWNSKHGRQTYTLRLEGEAIELSAWDGFEWVTLTLTKAEALKLAERLKALA